MSKKTIKTENKKNKVATSFRGRKRTTSNLSKTNSIQTKTIVHIVNSNHHSYFMRAILFLLKNIRFVFRLCLFTIVAAFISIVAIINNTDPNNFRADIENYIKYTTGKKAEITGDLRWKIFSFEPAILVNGLVIKNEPWSSHENFITTDKIIATISLKNLISRKISINTLILDTPKIYIDISKNGYKNWLSTNQKSLQNPVQITHFESPSNTQSDIDSLLRKHYTHDDKDFEINIQNIKINDAEIFYNNKQKNINETIFLNKLIVTSATIRSPILVSIDTKYKNEHLSGSFKLNSLSEILDNLNKIKITGVVIFNNMNIKFSGLLSDIKNKTPSFSTSLFLDAPDLKSSLSNYISLPKLAPINAELELIVTETFLSIKKIHIKYKNMNLSGTSEITLQSKKRPNIKADFHIPLFDIPTLFYPAWETAYYERIRKNLERPKSEKTNIKNPKAFRNIPLPVSELNLANFNVSIHIDKLKAMPEMPVEDINITAILSNGKGIISPISFKYMGGNVRLDVLANNFNNTFNGQVAIKGENINIGDIVDSTGYKDIFKGGNTNIDIILSGSGQNLAKFMEKLNGYIKVYTTTSLIGYPIENTLMAGDLFSSVVKFFRDDVIGTIRGKDSEKDQSDIRCAVINLNIHKGQTESNRGIAIETSAANIIIDGLVNFGTEYLDVSIITVVKEGLKLSGNLADMIKIQGAMAKPKIIMNRNGIINNLAKTTVATALAGALTGGVSLVATGIGFFTKSWLDNIGADSHPCLTALEGHASQKDPKIAEEFRNQTKIKQQVNRRLNSEKTELNTITNDNITDEKLKIKSSNK